MCKLNILCKELDGKCNCSGPNNLFKEKAASVSGILVSILDFIQLQPDIMRSLQESAPEEQAVNESSSSSSDRESNPTQDTSQEELQELSISLLSEPVKKVTQGKAFSMILKVLGSQTALQKLRNPVKVTASIVGKFDNAEKAVLGEVVTTGTIYFKKLVIFEDMKEVSLLIKCHDDDTILPYIQEIIIKRRKRSEPVGPLKIAKILE